MILCMYFFNIFYSFLSAHYMTICTLYDFICTFYGTYPCNYKKKIIYAFYTFVKVYLCSSAVRTCYVSPIVTFDSQ